MALAFVVAAVSFTIAWSTVAVRTRRSDLSAKLVAVASGIDAAGVPNDRLFEVESHLLGTALFVTDARGVIERATTETSLTELPLTRLAADSDTGVRSGVRGTSLFDGAGALIVAAPLADGRWVIAVEPLDTVQEGMQPVLAAALIAALVAALVSTFAWHRSVRALSAPLERLTEAARLVTGGAWGTQVPVEGDAEVVSLAESFNDMSRRVAQAYEAQRAFVGDISHEIRTPLTSIRGFAEAIADGTVTDPEAVRRSAGIVRDETVRMAELADTLLSLARMEAGAVRFEHGPIDVAVLAEALMTRFQATANATGVRLVVDLDAETRPCGDRDRLLQASSALVENALAHSPRGGDVIVSATVDGGRWCLRVDDSGEGVPPDAREAVFERFSRLGAARSNGGAGLGLAICRRITELMGGTVSVSEAPAGGARFEIRLDIEPCESPRTA